MGLRSALPSAVLAFVFFAGACGCAYLAVTAEFPVPYRTPGLRGFFVASGGASLAVALWLAARHLLLCQGYCVITVDREHLERRLELFSLPLGRRLRVTCDRVYDLRVVRVEGGWHVAFDYNGRTCRLGVSMTEEEAQDAYRTLKPFVPRESDRGRFRLPAAPVCDEGGGTVE